MNPAKLQRQATASPCRRQLANGCIETKGRSEGLEVLDPLIERAEAMHEHDGVACIESLGLDHRRSSVVKKLAANRIRHRKRRERTCAIRPADEGGHGAGAPATWFNAYTYPGGEELLLLEGVFRDEGGEHPDGIWLHNPRWSRRASFTGAEGALIYFKVGGLVAPFLVSDT